MQSIRRLRIVSVVRHFQVGTLIMGRGVVIESKAKKPIIELTDLQVLVEYCF